MTIPANMAQEEKDVWIDLNLSKDHAREHPLENAICELVANALDASEKKPQFRAVAANKIELEDQGPGLSLDAWVVGRSSKAMGHFGLGLKDAMAILMREKVQVQIESSKGNYHFKEKRGQTLVETIHVQQTPSSRDIGTKITLSLQNNAAQELVTEVQTKFLRLSSIYTFLGEYDGVQVFSKSDGKPASHTSLFVKGFAMTTSSAFFFSYNILSPTQEQNECCNRDHHVTYFKPFRAAIIAAVENLWQPKLAEAYTSKYRDNKGHYELAWTEFEGLGITARHSYGKPQASTNLLYRAAPPVASAPLPAERFLAQLAKLAKLPPASTSIARACTSDRAHRILDDKSGPVTLVEVNRLINHFSPEDAVPPDHRKVVDRLVRTLHEDPMLSVDEVYPGGSYAKGTSTGAQSDVDLLVVLNDIPTENHSRWLYMVLTELRRVVELGLQGNCQDVKVTRFAVQLRVDNVNVDLLPVPAALWRSTDQRMKIVNSAALEDRRWLSVAFAKEQVKYVREKKETAGVTGIIRLIKRWLATQKWRSKPPSFLIELMVLEAKSRLPEADHLALLNKFWELVRHHETLCIIHGSAVHAEIAHERPLVVDPANPTNNVAGSFQWDEFVGFAREIHATRLRKFVRDLS
ncbi:uncharacterized protein MONBRDRAFT_39312 [Monosiga brevicollis MX1]|uniref:Polymerase nucleotidyl transferase domain-containing protein n=1 Tax=Monosiga brevicollis TaxID=81824 RepID=A9VDN9_MONBE|nr:uncharacterized protein MONBRDRAFT_39312 [Monosiga brevicollis MX1]EDQ84334.1 predicted protein [Monosiga brevicollis MX1]|eukprot:XP_001750830.1 hypothetical protein [Monosiga brevicollis MX1]